MSQNDDTLNNPDILGGTNAAHATISVRSIWIMLGLILVLSLGLRLWGLGAKNFDFDEFSTLYVTNYPSFGEMLQNFHKNLVAMPFDYIIWWSISRFSTAEAWLRLPQAIWGALAILPTYGVAKRLFNQRTGFLAAFLLALTPFHIQYSQEFRTYSSLVFFYFLSIYLYLWASDQPDLRHWIIFCAGTIIGIYFHVYVILALACMGLWFFFTQPELSPLARRYIVRSVIVIILALLAGILLFTTVNGSPLPFLLDEHSLLETIGVGLGLAPFYPVTQPFALVFGLLILSCALLGLARLLAHPRQNKPALLFLLSGILQFAVILAFDLAKNYFFAPRQVLFLLPVVSMFAACGLEWVISWLEESYSRRLGGQPQTVREAGSFSWIGLSVLVLVFTISLPAIANYYRGDKGKVDRVVQILMEQWQPGDAIVGIPGFNTALIDYYLVKQNADPRLLSALYPLEMNELDKIRDWHGRVFLVVTDPPGRQAEEIQNMMSLEPLFIPQIPNHYSQYIWIKR